MEKEKLAQIGSLAYEAIQSVHESVSREDAFEELRDVGIIVIVTDEKTRLSVICTDMQDGKPMAIELSKAIEAGINRNNATLSARQSAKPNDASN